MYLPTVDDADAEAEEVLNDLNRLVEDADDILNLNDSQRQQEGDWNQHGKSNEIDYKSKSKKKSKIPISPPIPQVLNHQFHAL
jgi:hypothetical protein